MHAPCCKLIARQDTKSNNHVSPSNETPYLHQINSAVATHSYALQSIFLDVQSRRNKLMQVLQNQRSRIQGRVHGIDQENRQRTSLRSQSQSNVGLIGRSFHRCGAGIQIPGSLRLHPWCLAFLIGVLKESNFQTRETCSHQDIALSVRCKVNYLGLSRF
jgi:hypothetical protein